MSSCLVFSQALYDAEDVFFDAAGAGGQAEAEAYLAEAVKIVLLGR